MTMWPYQSVYVVGVKSTPKKYGFFSFLWDAFMVCFTAGFWLIWIFVREMRKR